MDVERIKALIEQGIVALPTRRQDKAVLVVGDTGVGKSTVISLLAKKPLLVRANGLNAVIASEKEDLIGHARHSQTTIPHKLLIGTMHFYDCSGFRDNRGDEYEISNSFFLQRLFAVYQQVKLLLIIDEHHISQARIDKLPRLIKSLHDSFGNLADLKQGVVLLINRSRLNRSLADYTQELAKMAELTAFFNNQERDFLLHLVRNDRVAIIKQADQKLIGKPYSSVQGERLLAQINQAQFIKSRPIKNILSQSTCLAIRTYIDELLQSGQVKFPRLAKSVVMQVRNSPDPLDLTLTLLSKLDSPTSSVLEVLIQTLPDLLVQDLERDFASVLFFRDIYDQSKGYFAVVKGVVVKELIAAKALFQKEGRERQQRQKQFLSLKNQKQALEAAQRQLEKDFLTQREEMEGKQKNLEKELYSQKQMKEFVVKSSQQLQQNYALKIKQIEAQLQGQKKDVEKTVLQREEENSKLQNKVSSLQREWEQAQRQLQMAKAKHLKLIDQFKERSVQAESGKNKEVDELTQLINKLKIESYNKDQELQLLSMENESLKAEISSVDNKSMASMDSKSSKYPYVECPHFRNGGKCKHCIKKWKDSLK